MNGDYPELLELIEMYDPSYNSELSRREMEFEKHVNELIQWFKDNKRKPKNAHSDDRGDCFEDGTNICSFLRNINNRSKIVNGNYLELLQLIKMYYPSYNSELSMKEMNFEKHINELIQWFKNNKRKPKYAQDGNKGDCFEDGTNICGFLNSSKIKVVSGDYPELLQLIEMYYPSYNSDLSMHEIDFENHVSELIQWFKDNKKKPKEAQSSDNKGDCFEDGTNICGFLRNNKSKIVNGDYPELLEQIEMYYPSYNSELSMKEMNFENHINELIQWFKENQRAPKQGDSKTENKGDYFEDGTNIYTFLRVKANKNKIVNGIYPELLQLIEFYYPSYIDKNNSTRKITSINLKLAKIEEIFSRYLNSDVKLSTKLKDLFEIDNTFIGSFLKTEKPFIFEQAKHNPHARWIIEKMSRWKKEYESAVQAFEEVSEFSRVMTKMEGKVNETGTHKLS